jgi:hypothetical protein
MKRYKLRVSYNNGEKPEEFFFDTLEELVDNYRANKAYNNLCMAFDTVEDKMLVIPDDPNQLDLFI